MGRLLMLAGFLLDTIVIGLFVLTLSGVGMAETLTGVLLESFVCEETETMTVRESRAFCIDSNSQERQVTEDSMPYLFGGTILSIVIGAMMINVGNGMVQAGRDRQNYAEIPSGDYTQAAFYQQGQPVNLEDTGAEFYQQGQQVNLKEIQAKIPPEAAAMIREVFSHIGQAVDTDTLASRLQQLEDARQQGLITREEYDRVRQAILDGLDD